MGIINLFEGETTFQRANRIAEERKRLAWARYTPLPKAAFVDDWGNPSSIVIRVVDDTGTRSTFASTQLHSTGQTIARPTELAATASAYAGHAAEELVVIRLEPEGFSEKRKCPHCGKLQAEANFDRDKRNVSGLSWYCKPCRDKLRVKPLRRAS